MFFFVFVLLFYLYGIVINFVEGRYDNCIGKWIDLDMITDVAVDFKLHVYKELKDKITDMVRLVKEDV